jgi:hypothetical protein
LGKTKLSNHAVPRLAAVEDGMIQVKPIPWEASR